MSTNILYVLNSPNGGATQGVIEMLRGLRGSPYRAYVAVPSQPDAQRAIEFQELTEDYRIVPMSWWNLKRSIPLWYRPLAWGSTGRRTGFHFGSVAKLTRLIRAWNIDLVYSCTAMVIDGAIAARRTGRPHIWHVKDWVGRNARVRFPLPDRTLARLMGEHLSDRLVAMTEFVASTFRPYVSEERIKVIYDGVNLADYMGDGKGRELRKRLGVTRDQTLVATAGSLGSTSKRHDLFLEMASRLTPQIPGARFVMFGSTPRRPRNPAYRGPWTYYRRLQERAKGLGLDGDVLIGVHTTDIPEMMDAIDILVHMSEVEAFGRVAIEAMAAGRPVVGPTLGGIAESVVDGETGLLMPPGDAKAFAEATAALVEDPQRRSRMGLAGRKRAETMFSLDRHVQEMTAQYREVLR